MEDLIPHASIARCDAKTHSASWGKWRVERLAMPITSTHAKCGAKTRAGSPCKRRPARGRTRCRLHGGASRRWWNHPRFKHGKYSKYSANRIISRKQRCRRLKLDGTRCRQWAMHSSVSGECFAHSITPINDIELEMMLARMPRWAKSFLSKKRQTVIP